METEQKNQPEITITTLQKHPLFADPIHPCAFFTGAEGGHRESIRKGT